MPLACCTEAAPIVPDCPGLLQWVVIDPTREATYSQAEEILKEPHCVGIKIHPEEHVYLFRDHGRRIFEFASKHRAVILTHSGEANSLPADIVEAANEFPDVRVILAHIGCSDSSDRTLQVRAILQSTRGNVYADTSSATSMQRARINLADLDDNAKRRILRDNALSLLDIPETHATTAENR